MRPFAEACEALPRAVRDLATTAGKEIEIEVLGGEVEVDRAVLDGVREALLHLVRNAADHGIEPPEARERVGKPRRGTVSVSAALRGDRFTSRYPTTARGSTCGSGPSTARVAVPAMSASSHALFEGGMSAGAGDGDLRPGWGWTSCERRSHGSAGGTSPGRDTADVHGECRPLANIRALLAAVGPQIVAVPTTHVERLLRVRPEEIKHAEGRDVIATPAAPVPLVALARLLPPLVERPVAGPLAVILLRAGERRLAVAVDDLVAEQEVVLRPLGRRREPLPHVSGAAILGSGRVALVLNAATIVAAGLGLGPGSGLAVAEAKPGGPAKRRILVVDDSITTRTLEQSIFEAAGYDVRTAVDGADGWKLLQEHGCDGVVADIEMPRMDGFALCEAIRGSKRFKELPVVLVTALETPEHRARGLEVGADAYIGKSSFDQQNLLDTISQLLG
jgi:two-component system chemotaxis sensor kinase CheA